MKTFFVSAILCSSLLFVQPLGAQDATKQKLNAALDNWRTVTPEVLRQPENADLVEALRVVATNKNDTAAIVPLLKLGDEQTVRQCLQAFRSDWPNAQIRAKRWLFSAANPALVPLLAADLLQEESSSEIMRGEYAMLPTSVAAAAVIKMTLMGSPVFKPEVRAWASALTLSSEELRQEVRAWWRLNQAALTRGDYQAVTVPPAP